MHLLGEKAWWIPRWLDRILPDVDVEGASLARSLEADAKATPEPEPAGRHTA
jgi:RND superfamily putative drug exporter